MLITSSQNPKIKQIAQLKNRRERDLTGRFLIEGYREISRAVLGKVCIEQLLYCEELFLGSNEPELLREIKKGGAELIALAKGPFSKLSYRDRPDGLIAVAEKMNASLSDIVFRENRPPFLLVAEAIEKPGNLGSILRSADAVGADGVIVVDRCTDIYNPNVVRASVGTLFTVPVVEAAGKETLDFLRQQQIQIIAATPSAEQEFTQVPFLGAVAIAVGTEQLGLSKQWMEEADLLVKIPMLGKADSLNVATATTLLLYEVLRQRSALLR